VRDASAASQLQRGAIGTGAVDVKMAGHGPVVPRVLHPPDVESFAKAANAHAVDVAFTGEAQRVLQRID
jgi:hypothetical protein